MNSEWGKSFTEYTLFEVVTTGACLSHEMQKTQKTQRT